MAAPAPRPRSMSDIKSKLLRPALTSHYECFFNPPSSVRSWSLQKESAGAGASYDSNQDLISISCSEASLPGSSLATIEINNDYSGVTERHAYRRLYDDRADFTFYVDGDYKIIRFFENWISYIVGERFTGTPQDPGIEQQNYYYRVNFPGLSGGSDSYRSPALYINKFERDYRGSLLQYRFLNAYPISINSMPVSYDSSSLLKCTVSFTYTRYIMTNQNTSFSPANIIADQTEYEQSLAQATGGGTLSGAGTFQELNQIQRNPLQIGGPGIALPPINFPTA